MKNQGFTEAIRAKVTPEFLQKVEEFADKHGTDQAKIVRVAVALFLKEHGIEAKDLDYDLTVEAAQIAAVVAERIRQAKANKKRDQP